MNLLRPPLRLASKVGRLQPAQRIFSKYLQQGLKPLPRAASVDPKPKLEEIASSRISTRASSRPHSSNIRRQVVEPPVLVNRQELYKAPAQTTSRERCHSSFVMRMKKLEIALDADLKYREKLEIPEGFFSPKSSASTRAQTPLWVPSAHSKGCMPKGPF
mmetsp:Transcript_15948/g.29201  ORF Transcript_15948/g.29201 Transcript_15948/m.29201 type:complete len:160 (+) Transcript_15948:1060-1539(+)